MPQHEFQCSPMPKHELPHCTRSGTTEDTTIPATQMLLLQKKNLIVPSTSGEVIS